MAVMYSLVMANRLQPLKPWRTGLISETRAYRLEEAARLASAQAGREVSVDDILSAVYEEWISLKAIVHRQAQLRCCIEGDDLPTNPHGLPIGTVPNGAILTLPRDACIGLANVGRAAWRGIDDFTRDIKIFGGELCRYTRWVLVDSEPDFQTVLDDCRVTGYDVHALADELSEDADLIEPVLAAEKTPEERRLHVVAVLAKHGGNKAAAGRELGITGVRVGQIVARQPRISSLAKGLRPDPKDPFGQLKKGK